MLFDKNICKFIQFRPVDDTINTIHFVYETETRTNSDFITDPVYKVHYVTSGTGTLRTRYETYSLSAGDIFFTFPSVPYAIELISDFKYLYISYLGIRTNKIMDQLNINSKNCVCFGYPEAETIWKACFELSDNNNLDMVSQSALLYTLSLIEKRVMPACPENDVHSNILQIKKYIDSHYQDPSLSLDKISKKFSYHKKYISAVFKKQVDLTICQYINTIRLQNACSLMEKNITCIKDISYMCGFSDPLYFSKVFKKQIGISPKQFIAQQKNR